MPPFRAGVFFCGEPRVATASDPRLLCISPLANGKSGDHGVVSVGSPESSAANTRGRRVRENFDSGGVAEMLGFWDVEHGRAISQRPRWGRAVCGMGNPR